MGSGRLPDKLPNLDAEEVVDNIVIGKRAWFKVLDPDSKTGTVMMGTDGELTYAGYQVIGNQTFLVLDRSDGVGKKSKVSTFGINASHVLLAGPVQLGESD